VDPSDFQPSDADKWNRCFGDVFIVLINEGNVEIRVNAEMKEEVDYAFEALASLVDST
jgi:hypothetical protein